MAPPKSAPAEPESTPAEPERLVIVRVDGDGFSVHTQGVEQIAAPTLLRLAAKQVEKQLGLE